MDRRFGGKQPTGTPSFAWSCAVVVVSLLSGASVVHNIYKPDLVCLSFLVNSSALFFVSHHLFDKMPQRAFSVIVVQFYCRGCLRLTAIMRLSRNMWRRFDPWFLACKWIWQLWVSLADGQNLEPNFISNVCGTLISKFYIGWWFLIK